MKAVIIYPRYKYPMFSGGIEPLGILYLASALEKAGVGVDVFDMAFENDLRKLRNAAGKADFAAFSFPSALFDHAARLNKILKTENPRIVTVAGGPHPTVDRASVLDSGFDFAAIGEGERIITDFAKNLSCGKEKETKGLSHISGGKIAAAAPMPFIEDIDSISFPARRYIDYKKYDSIGIIASRGCPFNCLFCQPILNKIFGKTFRERSLDNIVEELKIISSAYPGKRVRFEDDTFTSRGAAWFDEFGERLKKEKIKLKWQCNSRVDTIDREKARVMKEAGCAQINFGVESGSKSVLDFYRKGTTSARAEAAFRIARDLGMLTHAFIMLGAPNETKADLNETVKHVKNIKPDKAAVYVTAPLPGSDLFDYCENKGLLNIECSSDYDNAVATRNGRSPLKLKYIKSKDIASARRRINFYIIFRSLFNPKILKILFTEPRRIVKQINKLVARSW